MKKATIISSLFLLFAACDQEDVSPPESLEDLNFRFGVPTPGPDGWGEDDELGNGNTQGYVTRARCAFAMLNPQAKVYDLGRPMTETMPQALFANEALTVDHLATEGLPGTLQVANSSNVAGTLGQQGTQLDALMHFGRLDTPWNPEAPDPSSAVYYNGFGQADVKPTSSSGLLKGGIEKAPPIITMAVVLDASNFWTPGSDLLITRADIDAMVAAQIPWRGIRTGDAVFIHTGYGNTWPNPDYYIGGQAQEAPGLSRDGAERLAEDFPVSVGLDNPFTDAFRLCSLSGACPPPDQSVPGVPFPAHDSNLTIEGIQQVQNPDLSAAVADGVKLGCLVMVPLPVVGAAGSPIRPILIGK